MQAKQKVSAEVRQAITETEQQSEILISLIQVGFVLFMGSLNFIAPKGYMGDASVQPVSLVLLGYGLLSWDD